MKKILSTISLAAVLASSASADLLRVEAGAGVWGQKGSGSATLSSGSDLIPIEGEYTTNGDNQTDIYVWALFKHFIPLVPNVRLEYTTLTDEGKTSGDLVGYPTLNGAYTTIDMKQFDIIPYYNILDNTFWITLDVGLDIKYTQSDVTIDTSDGTVLTPAQYTNSSDVVVPLLYVRGRVQVPGTGLGFESDIKYITDGDSTVYDARAKVDYTFDITPLIQPGIEVGYRIQKYDINTDDTTSNLEYKGVYAGVMLRF